MTVSTASCFVAAALERPRSPSSGQDHPVSKGGTAAHATFVAIDAGSLVSRSIDCNNAWDAGHPR